MYQLKPSFRKIKELTFFKVIDKEETTVTTDSSTPVVTGSTSTEATLMKLKLNDINSTLADIDTTLHNLLTSRRSSNANLAPGGEI